MGYVATILLLAGIASGAYAKYIDGTENYDVIIYIVASIVLVFASSVAGLIWWLL